jgi:hypothetical protein
MGSIVVADVDAKTNADGAKASCMFMAEKGDEGFMELGPVPIPDEDGNWKSSVSIGGLVCMILCAIQVIAYCKPDGPKRRQQDDDGVELKNQ